MTRFVTCCLLLCLCCLPSHPATAQTVSPLPPVVVQLVPGDLVSERLVGMDSITYQASRRALLLVAVADQVQAAQARELTLTRQQLAVTGQELRTTRQELATTQDRFAKLAEVARQQAGKPPARPLLLDWHTYLGAVVGAGVGFLLIK